MGESLQTASVAGGHTGSVIDMSENQLFETARLGVEIEKFIATPTGQYLWGKAEQLIADAYHEFLIADPMKPGEVMAAQNNAKLGAMFKTWLISGIEDGQNALVELEREELE